jgi:multidrug efflux system membrane fusion protein
MAGLKKIIVIILCLVAAYFFYTRMMTPPSGMTGMPGGEMQAPPVAAAEVIVRKVQLWQEFSGRLMAMESAEIRPRVSGTIEKVHFEEGQIVEKGDPLFTIDPRTYQAALQSAQAQATLAEAEFERAKSLVADKALPQREYDSRKNAVEMARAELTRAKLDMEYTSVKAPISGRVSRAEITVGNLVDAGGMAPVLTRIVSDRPIYADFDIDEQTFLRYLQSVASDQEKLKNIPVMLGLSGSDTMPYQGHVQSFDNQLDVMSGTIRVRAVFANEDGDLIPGLFARVRMGSPAETEVILITDRAVGTDQNKKFVLVIGEGGATERREIKLGGMSDGFRIIESGLKPGEKIIVSGLQRVMMPGQPVAPEIVPMDYDPLVAMQAAPKTEEAPAAQTQESPQSEAQP